MATGSGRHFASASNPQNPYTTAAPSTGAVPMASMSPRSHAAQKPAKAPKSPKGGKGGKSKVFSNILLGLGIVLILVAVGMWGYSQWQYSQQDQQNDHLASFATVSDDGSNPPIVDWDALRAINADVVGWIQIPGTVINYPVYQGDDNDHYLNTTAEGNYSVGGQIFLDAENTPPGMVDQQSIIYGHHLKNGSMFKQIADMDQQGLFDTVSTIWYVTQGVSYELQPLLVYYTDPDDTNVRTFNMGTSADLQTYLNGLLSRAVTSTADAAKIISGTNHVLTLSTCNYIEGYGRTILVCVEKNDAVAALNPTS